MAGSVAFALCGFELLTSVPFHLASPSLLNFIVGALTLILFGSGSLVLFASLWLDVPRLTLNPEGFRIHHLRGSAFYPWTDVGPFTASGQNVRMDFEPAVSRFRRIRAFNRRWFGSEGMIGPYVYGMSAPELADLLNNWRNRSRNPLSS